MQKVQDVFPDHYVLISHSTRCPTRSSSKAAGSSNPEAYSELYVEGFERSRTQLAALFDIRLKEPLTTEKERPRHPRMRDTQTNTPLALVDEVLLVQ